jgi:hypothetical protein
VTITRETLAGYLDDALSASETAQVEQALRQSEALRLQLRSVMQERDRGDHSIGAIWRRERLTCPTREQLGSFVLGVLDGGLHDYIEFHLQTVGCAYCQANLTDLKAHHQGPSPQTRERRRRYFESSAGYLRGTHPDTPGKTKKG